ncbi:MAG: site-specific DNA-methyltransferase [Acidimicrobiales bacterium]|nr:site-specific DNA-methyltransferase [Acidimicrobiales bacterium]MYI08216.1 site-specific DNA-methyltransferase [Acidimicrobiales bacterium]
MNAETNSGLARFDLASLAPKDDRYAVLRDLIPEAFAELELDLESVRRALGDCVLDPTTERYGLSWPGKGAATVALQEPTVACLRPDPACSREPEAARDILIEGDNLEVLKLLQRAYHGKVKMIYIDPPYNTGNEFIYPDDFREGLASYLEFTGQADEGGRQLSANAETSGRYHSNWLSMMYPRLALARNLLRSDGVIFVTIDDHEVHNLRLLMDEVFGPENFVASCIWQKIHTRKNSAQQFSANHDYVLVYGRDGQQWRPKLLPRTAAVDDEYSNPDDDPRGAWSDGPVQARNYYSRGTYAIGCPGGRVIAGPPSGTYWRVSEEEFWELDRDNRIWWGPDGNNVPRIKRFLTEVQAGLVPQTIWPHSEVGHTQRAKEDLLARVTFESSDSVFDTPKPVGLIERMLRLATDANGADIVLDFFAGSGATGEAVWKLNAEDDGDRRFVLVQLPEPTGYDDYATVAEITRARLDGAADALQAGHPTLVDGPPVGFRTYYLAESNFRVWNTHSAVGEDGAVSLFADGTAEGATGEGIVAELLLKAGFELIADVDQVDVAGVEANSVADGQLLIVADGQLTLEAVEAMVAMEPALILVLDRCFGDDDELKVNTMQTVRAAKGLPRVRSRGWLV